MPLHKFLLPFPSAKSGNGVIHRQLEVKSDVMAKSKLKNGVMVINAGSCIHTLPVFRYEVRF